MPRIPGTAATRHQRLTGGAAHLDQHRDEQALRFEAVGCQPLERALVQDALVRHVLVDDGDALGVHRDDERVAELT
jgi:hypothetical protein